MTADTAGNDLDAVAVPIGGFVALAPVALTNVIAPDEGGEATLTVPEAYKRAGLIKTDGGPESADAPSGDAIVFWQQGYEKKSGDAESTIKVGFAENSSFVRSIVRGIEPDENGHIYVDAAGSDKQFLALTEEVFKSPAGRLFLERTNGVVTVSTVERDRSERGSVRGWIVTFKRLPSDLFGGTHYSEWVVNEAATPVTP